MLIQHFYLNELYTTPKFSLFHRSHAVNGGWVPRDKLQTKLAQNIAKTTYGYNFLKVKQNVVKPAVIK